MIVERPGAMDELTVLCEPAEDGTAPDELAGRVQRALYEATGLTINVQVLAPGEIPRSEGKAVRVAGPASSVLSTRSPTDLALLPADEVQSWLDTQPSAHQGDFEGDMQQAAEFFRQGGDLLGRLPEKARRSEREHAAAEAIKEHLRAVRAGLMRTHADAVYRRLTAGYRDFVRAEALVYRAAELFPD